MRIYKMCLDIFVHIFPVRGWILDWFDFYGKKINRHIKISWFFSKSNPSTEKNEKEYSLLKSNDFIYYDDDINPNNLPLSCEFGRKSEPKVIST